MFNSLPDDKFLALSKSKAFTDDKFIMALMAQFFSDGVENIVEKGENAGFFSNFSFSHKVFKKATFSGSRKPGIVWERVKSSLNQNDPQFWWKNFLTHCWHVKSGESLESTMC